MEVHKEAFGGLMEYYKNLPKKNKRIEIINELEEIIAYYSKICTQIGMMPDMVLNKEMLNINTENLTEDAFLHAVFAYLNTLQDISGQFLDSISDYIAKGKDFN